MISLIKDTAPTSISDLCDYSDTYAVAKETISVTRPDNTDEYNKKLAFKNNEPFISCI